MAQRREKVGRIRRFMGWLFGAPFHELPPEFGDEVPSELRVFEAQAEEVQHQSRGRVPETPDEQPASSDR